MGKRLLASADKIEYLSQSDSKDEIHYQYNKPSKRRRPSGSIKFARRMEII
jgi:hypothetical protein